MYAIGRQKSGNVGDRRGGSKEGGFSLLPARKKIYYTGTKIYMLIK
jgi:hypothetical protein